MQSNFVRKNGLGKPHHPLQILSWVLTIVNFIICSVIFLPFLDSNELIWFSVVYYLTQCLLIIVGYIATKTDPTDQVVYQHLTAIEKGSFDTEKYNTVCSICTTCVNPDSKHCGRCNRCVNGFDHHCKWLNNCIGRSNYRYFLLLIGLLEINTVGILSFSMHLCVKFHTELDDMKDIVKEEYASEMYQPFLASIYFLMVESAVILIGNSNLIALHIWLYFHKMTTYEYICYRRKLHKSHKVQGKISNADKIKKVNFTHNDSILQNEDQFQTPRTERFVDKLDYSYLASPDNIEPRQDYFDTDMNSDALSRVKTEKAPSLNEIVEEYVSMKGVKDQHILGQEWNCCSSSV